MDHSNPFMGKLNWTDWTPQRWLHPSRCDCGCPGLEIESPCSWNRRPTLCTRPGVKTPKSPEGAPCFAKKNSMRPSAGRIILNFTGWMVFLWKIGITNHELLTIKNTFYHQKQGLPSKFPFNSGRRLFKTDMRMDSRSNQEWQIPELAQSVSLTGIS